MTKARGRNGNGKLFWNVLVNLASLYLAILLGLYIMTFVQEGGRYVINEVSVDGVSGLFIYISTCIILIEFPVKRLCYQVKKFFSKNRQVEKKEEVKKPVANRSRKATSR